MTTFNKGDKILFTWDDGDYQFIREAVFKKIENGWLWTDIGKFRMDRVKSICLLSGSEG